MNLTDTHCHLDYELFDQDRDEVVRQARDAGLTRILNPGIDLESSKSAIGLAQQYSQVFAAVGVHPNSSKSWDASTLKELTTLSENAKVVAIGEIGLDYYRATAPRYVQEQVLHHQLDLAAKRELPVIIHNRDAMDDIMWKLSDWREELAATNSPLSNRPGVLHSFSGDKEHAQRYVDMNFFIGITGPVTFNKADDLREIVRTIDMDKLLIETDSPFLTPHPFRGKRNQPGNVKYVAEKIAEIRSISMEDLAEKTTANATKLFNW